MTLKKIRCFSWTHDAGIRTYGEIRLLGTSIPNVVYRPKTPRANYFLRFRILLDSSYHSAENEILFIKLEVSVLDIWFDTPSGHKWAKYSL